MATQKHRLSLPRIEQACRQIDPVFLNTPQYPCESLGAVLGSEVVLKVETQNPVRSFKGRGADFLVSQLGHEKRLVCASAGNFGQAMAYACRKRGIPLTVFAATTANAFKLDRMRALGADVRLHGDDFDAAKLEARRTAAEAGARFVEDGLDIQTLEGAGTIGLELLRLPDPVDVLLIALGNGALLNGVAGVFRERRPHTRIIAVQAAGAPAMLESWEAGKPIAHDRVDTIADGIAVRLPIPQALEDMRGRLNGGILVRDESILRAMQLLHEHAGLVAEPSGAVGIAALLENPDQFRGKRVTTIICGSNLTKAQLAEWL